MKKNKTESHYLVGLIFWPLLFILSISCGSILGICLSIYASYEDAKHLMMKDIISWKKYPKKRIEDLIERKIFQKMALSTELPTQADVEKYLFYKKKFQEEVNTNTFPWMSCLSVAATCFSILPLRILTGIFDGPKAIYIRGRRYWIEVILKQNAYEKYLENPGEALRKTRREAVS